MNFHLVGLTFCDKCLGYGGHKLTLKSVQQFLGTLEKHITPARGYLYTALPTGKDVCNDQRLQNEFDLLPELQRLKKHIVTAPYNVHLKVSHTVEGQSCTFCSCLNNIPPSIISTRARCHPGNGSPDDTSLDAIVSPILALTEKAAFIDPYLCLTQDYEDTRFAKWINNNPRLTCVAFVRGQKSCIASQFKSQLDRLESLITPARWNALVIRAAIVQEKKSRLHARYIHCDQFTLGVEGGFQYTSCGQDEMTDVYLVDSHKEIDECYVTDRDTHFVPVCAWEKKAGVNGGLAVADKHIPIFPAK